MSAVDDLFDVSGQVALVTGGASGLGYAFAEILVQAGANVVIADWDAGALEQAVKSLADAAFAAGRELPALRPQRHRADHRVRRHGLPRAAPMVA